MAKKKSAKSRDADSKPPAQAASPPSHPSHAIRETVESIVIAFVLAFLFRTFEAEAFVIPTGSMAPTLMGRHKDVDCPQCGHRFRINASEEEADELLADRPVDPRELEIIGGMCPSCRFPTPVHHDLPREVTRSITRDQIQRGPSYNGDRILVNKYVYTVNDPQRWDVVVFHFPGNAQVNYIKRLVGLPGEVIGVYQGDLFVAENHGSRGADRWSDADFAIARKPPEKVLAMRQLVHDTLYDPAELFAAGWPLRWQVDRAGPANGWQVDAAVDGRNVRQRYMVAAGDEMAWLRYRHVVPSYEVWQRVAAQRAAGAGGHLGSATVGAAAVPQLVTDFNAYNTRITRHHARKPLPSRIEPYGLRPEEGKLGTQWVGDLMIEADVDIAAAQGKLVVDLVEGGRHFTCTFDLSSGRAALGCDDLPTYSPSADTPLAGAGSHRVGLANVDDQLLLWVDGKLVEFAGGTAYHAEEFPGGRAQIRPRTNTVDPGDLAPVGIGARGAKLAVTRLQVWRDIYYIADSADRARSSRSNSISDFDEPADGALMSSLAYDPSLWDVFLERRHVEFALGEDQFFVMGDNSPESSDARLWLGGDPRSGGRPGGAYLERKMLIGKALCVYWPHSWNRIPGTPIPFPLFPNFMDMRLVR